MTGDASSRRPQQGSPRHRDRRPPRRHEISRPPRPTSAGQTRTSMASSSRPSSRPMATCPAPPPTIGTTRRYDTTSSPRPPRPSSRPPSTATSDGHRALHGPGRRAGLRQVRRQHRRQPAGPATFRRGGRRGLLHPRCPRGPAPRRLRDRPQGVLGTPDHGQHHQLCRQPLHVLPVVDGFGDTVDIRANRLESASASISIYNPSGTRSGPRSRWAPASTASPGTARTRPDLHPRASTRSSRPSRTSWATTQRHALRHVLAEEAHHQDVHQTLTARRSRPRWSRPGPSDLVIRYPPVSSWPRANGTVAAALPLLPASS